MALRWLIHCVSAYAVGYSMDGDVVSAGEIARYPNIEGDAVPQKVSGDKCPTGFQMPLHYPRYKKADYDNMEESKIDMLLAEYGLSFKGTFEEKRAFAIGAFLWPDQL